jgi:hypothetical protein
MFRKAKDKREKGFQKKIYRRGEGGEGRVRIRVRDRRDRLLSVHVFNGYVASLSITLIRKTLPL